MNTIRLTMLREGREEVLTVRRGANLLESLQAFDDFDFDAPCGGKGTCGKCRVLVDGTVSPPDEHERKFLSPPALKKGERLACMVSLEGNCLVTPLFTSFGAAIVTDHSIYDGAIDSPLTTLDIKLPEPGLGDQRSDLTRLRDALGKLPGMAPFEVARPVLRELPAKMREHGHKLKISLLDKRPWKILPPEAGRGCGIAVDIGTTTVVAYLIDLETGTTLRVVSGLNMQKSWGGDVISRVQAAIDKGPEPLARAMENQLTRMIFRLIEEQELEWDDLRGVAIAGNTVMMHLFAGIDPRNIAVSPFVPVFTELRIEASAELLSRLPAYIPLILLPSISGYIGADIVAGMLAIGIKERETPALLIDIGTNGELLLGDARRILACSTAAGPAFEGATISCGVGGVPGAVNTVTVTETGDIGISTIADEPPLGICGSGIIDLAAILVRLGIVDDTGRLLPPDELPDTLSGPIRQRVRDEGFFIASDRDGKDLLFTPRDVREVQLAKAAVAAGIDVLLSEYGLEPEQVDTVYLAGGFGSFIDTDSAVGIGLLPAVLQARIVPAGNTAGAGAGRVLLSTETFEKLKSIGDHVEYIELSGSARFQERYVEQMFFSKL